MLNFSKEFQNETTKISKIWLDMTLNDGTTLSLNETRIKQNGFVRDTSTTVDGEFTVGAAVTSKLSLILDNSDEFLSEYDFRGATVVAYLGGIIHPIKASDGIHPNAAVTNNTQFAITGLTESQLELFTTNASISFSDIDSDYDSDYVTTHITAVSTSNNVTTITVHDSITITTNTYIMINQSEKVNVGRYYVDEYTYDGSNINLTAYDDMCKFDIPCKNDSGFAWGNGKTITQLVQRACYHAGLTIWNSTPLPCPSGYKVAQVPKQWDTMTWHDVISYCAQIMCCFARIVHDGSPATYKLKFEWYDTGTMKFPLYNGGTFTTTTTPYSDGADLDGGTFDPWNTGDAIDEGTFGNRENMHIVPPPYDISVSTDDVLITGTVVALAESDNINATDITEDYETELYGESGYVITISGNPLIETEFQADAVCEYIGDFIIGMRFRPLSATVVENPAMEAGDVAYVYGRNQNMYGCFLSHVTYTTNAASVISCDAQSSLQNLKGRYSGAQKTYALVQRQFEKSISDAEAAMSGIIGALSTTMGLNDFSYNDANGSRVYLFGNGDTLASSNIQWKFSAGALMVSSNYGSTWNAALSSDGLAVLQEVYAVKVNADYIEAGTLTVGGASKGIGTINIKDSTDDVLGTIDNQGIHYGKDSVFDDETTGFYLSSEGFSVGDADNDVFFCVAPTGDPMISLVTIRDNPYPDPLYTTHVATTFSIQSDYGSTNLGSAYSVFGGDVDINGDLDVDGVITNSSDRRLKEHQGYLGDEALEFIRQLKPVHYIRKGNSEIGFYAQDVEEADRWGCLTGENKGYKTLNYIEIIAPLVKYCQSLEERIEELEGNKNGHSE